MNIAKRIHSNIPYLYRDNFPDTKAAGAVNGTPAVPGPGTRVVTDTENHLSLASGNLVIDGGKAAPAFGDPILSLGSSARTAGRVVVGEITPTSIAAGTWHGLIGWTDGIAGIHTDLCLRTSEALAYAKLGGQEITLGAIVAGVSYKVACIQRATGGMFLIKGGIYGTDWRLFCIFFNSALTPLYPAIASYAAIITSSFIRVPRTLWLPTPMVSDGFSGAASDGLGHVETSGPGSGGSGIAYATAATWSVAGGVALNTPNLGVELVTNGNMETGDPPTGWAASNATLDGVADERTGGGGAQSMQITATAAYGIAQRQITADAYSWYKITGWAKRTVGASYIYFGLASGDHIQGAGAPAVWTQLTCTGYEASVNPWINMMVQVNGEVYRVDDMSCKVLTLSELFRLSTTSLTADVVSQVKVTAMTAYTQAGIAIRCNSATNPTAGIIAVFTKGAYVRVYEFSGGTWTQLISAVQVYTANDSLQIIAEGANIKLLHITSAGAMTTIGSTAAASVTTGGYHGLFSTDSGNTLDNFVVYPRGSGGEYNILNKWSS